MKNRLLILLILSAFLGSAQTKIDSLENALRSKPSIETQIEVLNQLSYLYRKKDPIIGKEYGYKALKLADKNANSKGVANANLYIGMNEKYLANWDQALIEYKTAEMQFKDLGDSVSMARAINGQGIVFKKIGDFEKAAQLYFKTANIYEANQDFIKLAVAYNNLGNLYKYSNDYNLSLVYHQKGLKLREKYDDVNAVSSSYMNLANTYSRLDIDDSALYYYQKAIEIDRVNIESGNLENSLASIGHFYVKRKESRLGREYLLEALEINLEKGDKDGIVIIYSALGKSYHNEKDYSTALDYYIQAEEIGKDIKSYPSLKTCYENLHELYNSTGNYKKAYEAFKLFKATSDSLISREKNNQLTRFQVQFGVKESERENDLKLAKQKARQEEKSKADKAAYEKERESQKMFIWFLSAGGILLLGILFLIWRSMLNKKKSNEILSRQQNEILLKNKSLETANSEILIKSQEIEQKNKDITDSINYAEKIQSAVLKNKEDLKDIFSDSFILYRPKDVISGDFYWFVQLGHQKIISVGDCTGHGVPGALMSMTGLNLMHQIVHNPDIKDPADAITFLDNGVNTALQITEDAETKDGMDIALCAFNSDTNQVAYCGANSPLIHISDGVLAKISPDKLSVGGHLDNQKQFTTKTIDVKKGDCLYMFSDGFADQFGGIKGKKFKQKNLRELLIKNYKLPMAEQKFILEQALINWMGDLEQVDDICFMGVRI